MNPGTRPLLRWLRRAGASDTLLDAAIVIGVCLFVLVDLVGRDPLTEALVAAYLVVFPVYLVYKYTTSPRG